MRLVGQGTVFRIDPWGNCATAFHVFEDAFCLGCGTTGREMMVRQGRSILALEIEAIVLGASPIAPRQWRLIGSANSIIKIDEAKPPRLRNLTLLVSLNHATGRFIRHEL